MTGEEDKGEEDPSNVVCFFCRDLLSPFVTHTLDDCIEASLREDDKAQKALGGKTAYESFEEAVLGEMRFDNE